MSPPRLLRFFAVLAGGAAAGMFAAPVAPGRPNVIVILADDLGWSDVGFNGCREIPTPNLDALARSGVRFTSGYASHPYCSPSRAGLLTGRYQQRFGHECNPDGSDSEGLPLTETLLPAVLRAQGYRTAAIGKWHLGDASRFWPTERGFDYWFGFSGGGMSYWGDANPRKTAAGVRRNGVPVPKSELIHLTDDFSREAADFIGRVGTDPFFLYLAYNAPHAPDQATRAHLQRTEHIEYGGRAVYGAMVAAMDAGIGRVLRRLEELKLRERTLVFFYSDNGGRAEHAVNFPLRGHKGMLFEGGIRVPFCVAWPQRIPGGRTIDTPITGLDVFPTVLAAAGIAPPGKLTLDGVNLLPHLGAQPLPLPPRTLVWRYATAPNEFGHAVREGRWKLVSSRYKNRQFLFDLEADAGEQHDLAEANPAVVRRLTEAYEAWSRDMVAPQWLDPHGANVRKEEAARQAMVDAASRGETKR
ncbi:MAG: sulfatase [Verrucomicrobia bacterium]|nr:sulfatase [Verrucomicrobiota bacterium]